MHMKLLFLTILLAITALAESRNIVCYFESWAKYRNGDGKYTINDIPANLCTHVIYSFVGINTDGTIKLLEDEQDLWKFTSFVKKHNGVKALVSIGGWNEGSKKFSAVVTNTFLREELVKNAVTFLKKYNFDGLDVDWEYPTQRSGRKSDKNNFVLLLKKLRQAFSSKGYILSAAVSATEDIASKAYDIPEISKHLHFINVMAYNFNSPCKTGTAMNSPLYSGPKDDSYQSKLNINSAVEYWLSQGAPRNKIILGLPFYGITFTLKDSNIHNMHAPVSGCGKIGKDGNIGYYEMCVSIRNGGWHVKHTKKQRVPYAYKDNQWISYDDPESIREKVEYIKSKNLGGAMIWSIDSDDFRGACGPKHVMLKTVHNALK